MGPQTRTPVRHINHRQKLVIEPEFPHVLHYAYHLKPGFGIERMPEFPADRILSRPEAPCRGLAHHRYRFVLLLPKRASVNHGNSHRGKVSARDVPPVRNGTFVKWHVLPPRQYHGHLL